MVWVETLSGVDLVAGAVLLLAIVRGAWNGAIREAFSLGAVAVAFIAARLGTAPVAAWLASEAPVALGPVAAIGIAGGAIIIGSLIGVGLAGRALRAGVRAAGLGFLDRAGGAALGGIEGALVVGVAIAAASAALGADHPAIRDTEAMAVYQAARSWPGPPDVAAGPN